MMRNALYALGLLAAGLPVPWNDPQDLPELPLPGAKDVAAARDLPIPATDTHPTEWANPGSLGPTGLIAQRCLKRLEYRVLAVEAGSPAAGRILPGDLVVGVDGGLFQPENYAGEHPSVANYCRFMEPTEALGRALDEAAVRRRGRLMLSVRRGERTGTVMLALPSAPGFSATYPWNCAKSAQVAEEIAARFAREPLPYRRDLYATAWYGLFLLNHDPVAYRGRIDEIAKLVLDELPEIRPGSPLRGFGGGTGVWHTAIYGMFLAEYALLARRQQELRAHLNRLADQLFDVRMVGHLWGHSKWHNYGSPVGGFVAASSHAALALLCLRQAGAAIDDTALGGVMDGLSASLDRGSGHVGYHSPDDGRGRQELDWPAILKDASQRGAESLMRQGAVQLALLLDGRTDEARAASRFMERMIRCHATHGIAPEWGIFEASRAFAATDPAACRRLLDAVRYRLNLCLRWDGGLQLVPYRNRPGEEYGVDTFRADRYAPAMWGLVLSMPRKRLYLLSKTAEPGAEVRLAPAARVRPPSLGARHLTCGGGRVYLAAPAGPADWGVYEHDPSSGTTRLLQGGLREPPHELGYWEGKLLFSVPGASLWAWDGTQARELQKVRSRKAAAQFTPFGGAVYFVSPPGGKGARGGELWRTDGTPAGTVKVKDGLGMLLGGNTAWQTDVPHAQSLLAALDRLFFVTCETDPQGKPLRETFALWTSDGTAGGIRKLLSREPAVVAVDHGNSPRGSFLGRAHGDRLYFRVGDRLWESDGTETGTRESPLGIRSPSNLSRFQGRLVLSGQRSVKGRGRIELIFTDGSPGGTRNFEVGVRSLRQITAVGDRKLFFAGEGDGTGEELWVSDGSPEQTRLVRELHPGAYGGMLDNLVDLDGQLYFTAGDGAHGMELWRSDGTADGTRLADLLPGPAGSLPGQLRVAGGKLHFATAAAVKGRQLWSHDPARPQLTFEKP